MMNNTVTITLIEPNAINTSLFLLFAAATLPVPTAKGTNMHAGQKFSLIGKNMITNSK